MNKEKMDIKILNWLKEEQKPIIGWDFSYLKGRMETIPTSWDYKKIIEHYLTSEMELLDMGTGGGEFLLTLDHPYDKTYITEGYVPNYELCINKLNPLGICVKFIEEDTTIPYPDQKFDTIINRHEAFSIKEVKRILKPNGIFITQQVGGLNDYSFSKLINPNYVPPYLDNNLNTISKELKKNEFRILLAKEEFNPIKFFDTEAFIYFAKIIEWEFPNFSVKKNIKELKKIEKLINTTGYICANEHRFLIVAQKK
ncbi:MAG: methyltransferase domain-containing protein [Sphaerochaetaceae bacterium]|nr:methyltransferase domain-containing protein [Sphaerochaetaceae bacterium]MDC7251028.1 methyltransferase domain-containing protein [Sphaerochaetaceae bacterium]